MSEKVVPEMAAAFGAGEATRDAFHKGVLIDREFDDVIQLAAPFGENAIQRFRLCGGARITVEDHAGKIGRAHV